MTEKLTLEDAYVMELVVNKINELIDRVDDMESRLDSRIDNHWKYHRLNREKKEGGEGETKQNSHTEDIKQ